MMMRGVALLFEVRNVHDGGFKDRPPGGDFTTQGRGYRLSTALASPGRVLYWAARCMRSPSMRTTTAH
jgi:hypothetical protein